MDDLRRLSGGVAATIVCLSAAAAFWALSAIADSGPGAPVSVTPIHARPQVVEPIAGGEVRQAARVHRPGRLAVAPRDRRAVAARPPASDTALLHAIGAKIMTGMNGTHPSPSLLERVRNGDVGGVILMGDNISAKLGSAIRALQGAARAAGDPPLVIATDQEGGDVRRLPNAPPVAAPANMKGDIAVQGTETAAALRGDGINTDLAPVADVLHAGSFIGTRSFGSNPVQVAADACQFAQGLEAGGINATFKHFPGLGDALTNTDNQQTTVSAPSATLMGDVAPYESCHPRLVMVSNAIYPALGSDQPAVFSHGIVTGILRDRFHFTGVTISDTLAAPGISSSDAAVRATEAGVDMLLYVDEQESAAAYDELRAAVRDHVLSRTEIVASAARIHALTTTPAVP